MSDLVPIRNLIAGHQSVAAIVGALHSAAGARLHIAPAIGAARTPLVAALAASMDRPLL